MVHISITEDMSIHTIVSALDASGAPVLAAHIGTTKEYGDEALAIGFDFPTQIRTPVDKDIQELNDVSEFLIDSLPLERITSVPVVNPSDPPDVVAYVDGREVGIEATQFLLPETELDRANSIIGRWLTFDRFRQRILEESHPQDFAQHEGLLVSASFGQLGGTARERLPPNRPVDVSYAIAELKRITPTVREGEANPPQRLEESDVIRYSTDRSVGFTWAKLPPGYSSPFYKKMKFELALAYYLTVTQRDLRSELRRLIAAHDNERTDVLVVTLNAPLRSGLWFPASSLVAKLLFEDEDPLAGWEPTHIKRIALHNQQTEIKRVRSGENGIVRWIYGAGPWP